MINDFFKPKEQTEEKKKKAEESEKKIEEEPEEEGPKTYEKVEGFVSLDEFKDGLCTWKKLLSKYTASPKFQELYQKVKKAYQEKPKKCYPPVSQIFNCFKRTTLSNIKVVIVGQDPYHQPNQAMGLCFSVNRGIKVPPSLVNIYKAIKEDPKIKGFNTPLHGDLTKWADQGVLLLNTVLTVEDSKPNSHKLFGWLDLTNEAIKVIAAQLEGIIFVLWGKPAMEKRPLITASGKKHHILTSVHPSPLSASKGFFTAHHFSQINELLAAQGKKAIDWTLPN